MKTGIATMRALRNALRPLLPDVRVEAHPISLDEPIDQLTFVGFRGGENMGEFNYNREERYKIRSHIYCFAPGAGEIDAEEQQDAAQSIFNIVRNYVTTAKPTNVIEIKVSDDNVEFAQGARDGTRWAGYRFDVDVWAEVP